MSGTASRRVAAALLGLGVLVAGCNAAPAADTPEGTVQQAFREIDEGDLDGLLALTCTDQQATIREQFGFGELGGSLGVDLSSLFAALNVDPSDLVITTASTDGDRAAVRLAGSLGISFDASELRDLFRGLVEQQGVPVTDAMLDGMVTALQASAQSVPVNETVDVVREDGAWKLCSRLTLIR